MSSTQEIALILRAEILNGAILPGQELRQEELAARFGVSRMPIRDALSLLSCDRLITLRPNRGGKVIALYAQDLAEIFDLRVLLEIDALERAVKNMDEQALSNVKLEMRRCEVEAGTPEFSIADWRFHKALYAPANRDRHVNMIKELRDLCQLHQSAYSDLRLAEKRWSDDHRKIVDAVEIKNAELAKSLLAAHLCEAGRQLCNFVSGTHDS